MTHAQRWKALAAKLLRQRNDERLTVAALDESESNLGQRFLWLCDASSDQIEALWEIIWALTWLDDARHVNGDVFDPLQAVERAFASYAKLTSSKRGTKTGNE